MPQDKKAHVVVRAHYTNGKPMKGTVLIVIERWYNELLLKKTVAINGQETIEFDIEKELKFPQFGERYKVTAYVTETVTGLSQKCGMMINVCSRYVIYTSPDSCVKFKRGSTANITVCIFSKHSKLLTNQITNFKISVRKPIGSTPSLDDPSKKQITVVREQFYENSQRSTTHQAVHQLNQNGDVVITLDIAQNEAKFSLTVCIICSSHLNFQGR